MNKSKLNNGKAGSIDLTDAKLYIIELLHQAGAILMNNFKNSNLESFGKGDLDIVTKADLTVDQFLRKAVLARYPHTLLLTEETAPQDYSEFKNLENLWVIDPLDGTVNYSRGHPNFAVSAAMVSKGVSKVGIVYVPATKETYWAQEDVEQPFLNDKPICVSKVDNLKESSFVCDWVTNVKEREVMIHWLGEIAPHVRQIKSMGSAVSDIASLADGRIDAYLNPGLKPWDLAAASLIVQKAGGVITTPEGEAWDIFNPRAVITNGILHDRILNIIKNR